MEGQQLSWPFTIYIFLLQKLFKPCLMPEGLSFSLTGLSSTAQLGFGRAVFELLV
jgi:hypothetical protein